MASQPSTKKLHIIYVSSGEWYPLEKAPEKNGLCGSGLYIDILNEIFTKQLKQKYNCSYVPWKRAQIDVKNGNADFIITIPTKERLHYTVPSDAPVFQLYLNIFTYKNHPKLAAIKKIKTADDILRLGLIPVSNLGNGWQKENIDSHGIQTNYISKNDNILQFLAARRADIVIDAAIPTIYSIKKLGLNSKIEITKAKFGPLNFHILLGKKSNYLKLLPEINKAVDKLIQDGTLKRLNEKYMRLE
jgi:polar amino acid transport system substrate-binding protein